MGQAKGGQPLYVPSLFIVPSLDRFTDWAFFQTVSMLSPKPLVSSLLSTTLSTTSPEAVLFLSTVSTRTRPVSPDGHPPTFSSMRSELSVPSPRLTVSPELLTFSTLARSRPPAWSLMSSLSATTRVLWTRWRAGRL